MNHPQLERVSATELHLHNPFDIPVRLYATPQVPLERGAVDQLLGVLEVQHTLERMQRAAPDLFGGAPRLKRVALTPDFHRGSAIPVGTVLETEGFVLPQALGNDLFCGMRLHTTSLNRDQLEPHLDALEPLLRQLYFGGGRALALTGRQRQALLEGGLPALFEALGPAPAQGLLRQVQAQDLGRELGHTEGGGVRPVQRLSGVEAYLGDPERPSFDSQLGSIGGGNHFVELGYVHRVLEPHLAHLWGLRPGQVTAMVHSGSLGMGHLGAHLAGVQARRAYPAGLARPGHGFFPLPTADGGAVQAARDALHMAANFACGNRFFLALTVRAALEQLLGDLEFPLLYDAPHNALWEGETGGLHRKGATPARSFEAMHSTPFAYSGEPILVPGSMGASSFVLAGRGREDALESASHGAGRARSRGEAMRGSEAEFAQFLRDFRVVTPLDWKRARADIRARKLEELKQEAPFAYKGIGPVIETLEGAALAQGVVELRPLLTVKG